MKLQISVAVLTIMIVTMLENKVVVVSAQNDHGTEMASSRKDQQLIETTCKNTPDYKLCMAVITANPASAGMELPELGLIVVAEIKKKTDEMMAKIEHLNTTAAEEMKPPLQKCWSKYNAIKVGNVPVAERAVRGNPKFAENAMADTKNEAVNCELAFKNAKLPSPFTIENKYVADCAAVARGIIRNLL